MVDINRLKGEIVAKGYTQSAVAEKIGLTQRQWYTRMKQRELNSSEMLALIEVLDLKNPGEIFFSK